MELGSSKNIYGGCGQYFLASLFFAKSLQLDSLLQMTAIFLILAPLTMDAFSCVLRRFFRGENIFKPHKQHLYQRLCKSGLSHSKVTLIYSLASLSMALVYNIFGIYSLIIMIIILIYIGFYLEKSSF